MNIEISVEPPRRQERQEIQSYLGVFPLVCQVIPVYLHHTLAQLGVLAVQKPFIK